MTVLSANQVAAAAYLGGFRGNQIAEAVAVAYGESSWDTTAANSCCHGLWQINTSAHPTMKANVYDPVQNATYAYQIYKSAGGWCTSGSPPNCNPWQAYGNSNYKNALPKGVAAQKYIEQQIAQAGTQAGLGGGSQAGITDILKKILGSTAVATGIVPPIPGISGNPLGGISAIVEALNRIGKWITDPTNIFRIIKVAGGLVVINIGVAILLEKPALQVASVVPQTSKIAGTIKKVRR